MARRTFFSFHYQPDCWRAWNARNSWVVTGKREAQGFFDSSVFEASKKESDEALKRFLREGMANTSVTCVLAGTDTWTRRWVRYEIARGLLKGNGLLTVDIHGIKNKNQQTSSQGADPLSAMGLYLTASGIHLAEWTNGKWVAYSDYTAAIPEKNLWFAAPKDNNVVALSKHCFRRDFAAQDGRSNLGAWIDAAATAAGR